MRFPILFLLSSLLQVPASADYDSIKNELRDIRSSHPQNVTNFSLAGGNGIEGVKIGNGGVNVLVVATHHGNEFPSTVMAMALARELASRPIPNRSVFIVPVLNVDGYNHGMREENGIDPNRDYPAPCGTESGGFQLGSTKALADFVASEKIVTAISLHTAGEMVVFPWGHWTKAHTAHHQEFSRLAQILTKFNGYAFGQMAEVMYPVRGDFESFVFWRHGVWSFLVELGTWNEQPPTPQQMEKIVGLNLQGMRELLAQSPETRATDLSFDPRRCPFPHYPRSMH